VWVSANDQNARGTLSPNGPKERGDQRPLAFDERFGRQRYEKQRYDRGNGMNVFHLFSFAKERHDDHSARVRFLS
jgi:hypothetical protein